MALYGPLYVTSSGLNKLQNQHYTMQLDEVINHDTDETAIVVYFEEYIEYEEAEDLLTNSGGFSSIMLEQGEDEYKDEDEYEEEFEKLKELDHKEIE